MESDELSRTLKEAYDREPETAESSDLLWERTRNALRERGVLESGRPWAVRSPAAALLAVASFAGGVFVGVGLEADQPSPPTAPARSIGLAAERAQEAGTVYAATLETLIQSLDDATPDEIAASQQVVASASEAHEQAAAPLLVWKIDPIAGEAAATDEPLIWF